MESLLRPDGVQVKPSTDRLPQQRHRSRGVTLRQPTAFGLREPDVAAGGRGRVAGDCSQRQAEFGVLITYLDRGRIREGHGDGVSAASCPAISEADLRHACRPFFRSAFALRSASNARVSASTARVFAVIASRSAACFATEALWSLRCASAARSCWYSEEAMW